MLHERTLEDLLEAGDVAAVAALLDQGHGFRDQVRGPLLPLDLAVMRGHWEIVALLLRAGCPWTPDFLKTLDAARLVDGDAVAAMLFAIMVMRPGMPGRPALLRLVLGILGNEERVPEGDGRLVAPDLWLDLMAATLPQCDHGWCAALPALVPVMPPATVLALAALRGAAVTTRATLGEALDPDHRLLILCGLADRGDMALAEQVIAATASQFQYGAEVSACLSNGAEVSARAAVAAVLAHVAGEEAWSGTLFAGGVARMAADVEPGFCAALLQALVQRHAPILPHVFALLAHVPDEGGGAVAACWREARAMALEALFADGLFDDPGVCLFTLRYYPQFCDFLRITRRALEAGNRPLLGALAQLPAQWFDGNAAFCRDLCASMAESMLATGMAVREGLAEDPLFLLLASFALEDGGEWAGDLPLFAEGAGGSPDDPLFHPWAIRRGYPRPLARAVIGYARAVRDSAGACDIRTARRLRCWLLLADILIRQGLGAVIAAGNPDAVQPEGAGFAARNLVYFIRSAAKRRAALRISGGRT